MTRPVHILAVGARTPVGLCAESTAAAVRAGISRVAEHPFMVNLRGEPQLCAIDGKLEAGLLGPARLQALLLSVLQEVVDKLSQHRSLAGLLVPCWLALAEERPGFGPREVARALFGLQQARWESFGTLSCEALPRGHAAAFEGLGKALASIASDKCDLCLVVAGESYLEPDTLLWLDSHKRVMATDARSAFAPGEGAACIALGSDEARVRLGIPSLGVLRAASTAQEPNGFASGKDNLGRGLSEAIAKATANLPDDGERIRDIYCDLNGERHRVEEWGFAALRTQRAFEDVSRYTTGSSAWGELGPASGALSVVLAVQAWQRSYARGRFALAWGSSDGGLCGATLIERLIERAGGR